MIYSAMPGDPRRTYPTHHEHPDTIVIRGYDYTPAEPNPDDSAESYRPVKLQWVMPDNGIYATHPVAANSWRGNRTYMITGAGATNTSMVMVNGVIIPVEFDSVAKAKLFAQHIEDTNTES